MRKVPITTILLAGILVLGAFLRFYDLAVLPPGLYPDEAQNGTNALEALHTGNFRVFYPENNGREGLFINIQALSVWLFGNKPWTLRVVSALFGTLTILGVYLMAKELFRANPNVKTQMPNKIRNPNAKKNGDKAWDFIGNLKFGFEISRGDLIALLSSFFIATSYWHINFSRIGFRAITVPFFAAFGIYWLLKGLRTGKISSIALAGIFIGLGFHTYIAFRFMPFVLAVPIIWYFLQWRKNKKNDNCIPCAIILFLFVTFIVALPIGWYFLQNPNDFFGRGGQVSIFAAEQPIYEFVKSNLITLQMFFWIGDCNPRHNLACEAQLHPIVALFFIAGVIIAIRALANPNFKIPISPPKADPPLAENKIQNPDKKNNGEDWDFIGNLKFELWILIAWFFFMMLPASLTTEGLPHALRAIGMIPPVMIFAGLGAYGSYMYLQNLLAGYAGDPRFAERFRQLGRIQKEIFAVFLLLLVVIAFSAYRNYFTLFEKARATYPAFRVDLLNMARYVNALPAGTDIYVLANYPDTRYGIPIEAEVVQYITDTARREEQDTRHIWYLLPKEVSRIQTSLNAGTRTELIPLNPREKGGVKGLLAQFPELKPEVMDDFVVLRNYLR